MLIYVYFWITMARQRHQYTKKCIFFLLTYLQIFVWYKKMYFLPGLRLPRTLQKCDPNIMARRICKNCKNGKKSTFFTDMWTEIWTVGPTGLKFFVLVHLLSRYLFGVLLRKKNRNFKPFSSYGASKFTDLKEPQNQWNNRSSIFFLKIGALSRQLMDIFDKFTFLSRDIVNFE